MHTKVRALSNLQFSIDFLNKNAHYVEIQKIVLTLNTRVRVSFKKL